MERTSVDKQESTYICIITRRVGIR